MKVKNIGRSAVAAAMIAGFLMSAPTMVSAEEISDAIKSVETEGQIRVGEYFKLKAGWAVPNHSQPGDTFTLELPEGLAPEGTPFDLKNAAGHVVAKAEVSNNVVTITLTDYVADNPLNIRGNLEFSVLVTQNATPGEPITISWGENVNITITPDEAWVAGDAVRTKYSWNPGGGNTAWTIEIPGALSNIKVIDTPGASTIDCGNIQFYSGFAANPGEYPDSFNTNDEATYECTPDSLIVDLAEIENNELFRIVYEVTPDAGVKEVSNAYTVTATEDTYSQETTGAVYASGGDGDGEGEPTEEPTPSDEPTTEEPTPSDEPTTEEPVTDDPTDSVDEGTEEPVGPSEEPTEGTTSDVVDNDTPSEEPVTDDPTDSVDTSDSGSAIDRNDSRSGSNSVNNNRSDVGNTDRSETGSPSSQDRLPRTGTDVIVASGIGAGMVLAGLGAIYMSRRRMQ